MRLGLLEIWLSRVERYSTGSADRVIPRRSVIVPLFPLWRAGWCRL